MLPPMQKKYPPGKRLVRVKRKLEEAQLSTIVVARKKQRFSEALDDVTTALSNVGLKSEQKLFNERPQNIERHVFRLVDQSTNEHFKVTEAKRDMERSRLKRRDKILTDRSLTRKSKLSRNREDSTVNIKKSREVGSLDEKISDDVALLSEMTYINVLQEDRELRPIPDWLMSMEVDKTEQGFIYDYYCLDEDADADELDVPQVMISGDWSGLYDNDSEFDGSEDEFDSEDSNAEGYYQNDYPDEVSSSEDEYDPYRESEVPYYNEC